MHATHNEELKTIEEDGTAAVEMTMQVAERKKKCMSPIGTPNHLLHHQQAETGEPGRGA